MCTTACLPPLRLPSSTKTATDPPSHPPAHAGSGKTTLLSAISLRMDTTKMEALGTIHLNGQEYDRGLLKAMSAYVMQDDLLHAELTVAETIKYAAELRLSGTMDAEQRAQRQKDVIALLQIEHVQDVIIGDTQRKGISGGERKRVCVAVELLTAPKLIFLDEVRHDHHHRPLSFFFRSFLFYSSHLYVPPLLCNPFLLPSTPPVLCSPPLASTRRRRSQSSRRSKT